MTKPEFIPEWRSAWRMYSVQVGALIVAWSVVSAEWVPAVLGALLLVGRLIHQPAVRALPTHTDDRGTRPDY